MPGGSSTEKGFFAPASPAFFTLFSQRRRGDTALGHQLFKIRGGKTNIFQTLQPSLASEVQVLFFLPAHMNLHGRHNSNDDSQGKCDSQNGQGVGRNPDAGSGPFL